MCGRGVVVGFPIDVCGDVSDGGGRGFFCEFDGCGGFVRGGFADGVRGFFGEEAFVDEAFTEEGDGVVVLFVVFDFLGGAVFLGVGVGDAVAVVAVGIDFQKGWFVFLAGTLHGDVGFGADFVDVGAVDDVPFHVVAFGALGEASAEGGGAFLGGSHGVAVVFDDVDDGEFEEGGDVEGFVECALVDGTIAEVAEGAAFEAFVFEAVCEAEAEGGLAGDDAVAAPVVFVGGEEVHGAAFSFGAAGGFAEEFGHAFVHVHADGEGVGVAAVGGDVVVVGSAE